MNQNIKSLFITILLLANIQVFAQSEKRIKNSEVEGIYLTVNDFKNGKLTHPTDKVHEGDKIKLKQFFISPEIICIEQDKKTVLYKDSIFGIRLNNGEIYRFINRTPCLIADTSCLYIYTFKTNKTEDKISGPHCRPNEVPVTYYYFSLGDHKTIYMLTMTNLCRYDLSDPFLHNAVCNIFTNDEMLHKINSQTGRFELNETILSIVSK
jgi:hypothetical protein